MEREFSLSKRWKNWMTIEDEKRCRVVAMRALSAGTATYMGVQGADWVLKHYNKLPEYYITTKKQKSLDGNRRREISQRLRRGV